MFDVAAISTEAQQIYTYFRGLFFILICLLLVAALVVEYFKLPLGISSSLGTTVGRVFVALVLMTAYPEVANFFAELSDALAKELGDVNDLHHWRGQLFQNVELLSFSWRDWKQNLTAITAYVAICFVGLSSFACEAFLLAAWILLYVLSPLLCALFVLPATASAATGLYRSLVEISFWKPLWVLQFSLLWSTGFSELTKPGSGVDFLTLLCTVIVFSAFLLLTPITVRLIASGSPMSGLMGNLGRVGLGVISVATLARRTATASSRGYRTAGGFYRGLGGKTPRQLYRSLTGKKTTKKKSTLQRSPKPRIEIHYPPSIAVKTMRIPKKKEGLQS